jgi:hypothetical protein
MGTDGNGTAGNGDGLDAQGAAETATEADRRAAGQGQGPDRRLSRADRRTGLDRRHQTAAEAGYTGPERRKGDRRDDTGLERRRGPGRRRSDERKSAEEGEMNIHQFEFVMAIETYKKVNRRMYPTWTEILEVVSQLGYRKVKTRNITLANVPEPKLYDGVDRVPEACDDEECDDCDCDDKD